MESLRLYLLVNRVLYAVTYLNQRSTCLYFARGQLFILILYTCLCIFMYVVLQC